MRVQARFGHLAASSHKTTSMKPTTQLTCDAILFDMDGVLIDSTPNIIRHWTRWATRHDLDVSRLLQQAHGMPTLATMRRVAPHLDVAEEARQFTLREIADTDGVVAIDGVAALLASLPENAWAVVTSACKDLASARLTRAGLPLPRTMVTTDDVTHGKPAPEPYLTGAKRLGLPPERCVVIEDAPAGIAAGRSAGIRVIGVCTTHTQAQLIEAGADFVVDRLAALRVSQGVDETRLTLVW